MQETQKMWVQILGQEDPLKKAMATHPNILAWRISWTVGYSPWGRKELDMTERLSTHKQHGLLCTQLPRGLSGKESACQHRRHRFYHWVGKIPWGRKWHPTPVFLPGESHGQRSLAGYSPWGRKVSDRT